MNQWDYEFAVRYSLCKRIEKIPGMGVYFKRFDGTWPEDSQQLRKKLGIPQDYFVLICAAEFSVRKSQQILIKAMTELPKNAVLILCGSGETEAALVNLAQRIKVSDRVIFPGQINDMSVWYQMADVCVTASRSEGLPFSIMEAMYMGLPVVASAVKGHLDLVLDGKNGLLYPYGDAAACAACVQLLMDDQVLRENIRLSSKKWIMGYELDKVLPEVLSFYLQNFDSRNTAYQAF